MTSWVATGHGKPGVAWNLKVVPGKPGITWNLSIFFSRIWKKKICQIFRQNFQILQFISTIYDQCQLKLVNLWIMKCLFPKVKMKIIEVNSVAFKVCFLSDFKVLDILQHQMRIFLSHVSSAWYELSKGFWLFISSNSFKVSFLFVWKGRYCLAVILWK